MCPEILLTWLEGGNGVPRFIYQWYSVTIPGLETDVLYAAMVAPQLVFTIISGLLTSFLVVLSTQRARKCWRNTWFWYQIVGFLLVAITCTFLLTSQFCITRTASSSEEITLHCTPVNVVPECLFKDSNKPGATTDNKAIDLGSSGAWDQLRVHHPSAIEKDGTVYLFYSGQSAKGVWKIGVSIASTATFTGKGFIKSINNPILSPGNVGSWDETGVLDPFVIHDADADLWKMWYRGVNSVGLQEIGYAVSNDPVTGWRKLVSNPVLSPSGWEGNIVMTPSVLRQNSSTYKMLYTGNEPTINARIGLATSSDGIRWKKSNSNPVLEPSGSGWCQLSVFSPRTLKMGLDGFYYVYYSGKPNDTKRYSKIGVTKSRDFITWIPNSDNPVLSPTRSWEGYEVENLNCLNIGRKHYLYYDCWFGNPKTIGFLAIVEY